MSKPKTVYAYFNGHPERWCQHSMINRHGQRCLLGALEFIYPRQRGYDNSCLWRAQGAVVAALPSHYESIVRFNDRPRRTFKQILAVVKKAGI